MIKDTQSLSREKAVYGLLYKIFSEKAYSSRILDAELKKSVYSETDRGYITMLFYGVLDKSIQFDYIVSSLCKKEPKLRIKILLKIGLYLLRYSDTPDYASVNKTVELAKQTRKEDTAGFVNAVLKNSHKIKLPQTDNIFGLSITASAPEWLTQMLVRDYGFDFAKQFLLHEHNSLTHIRNNGFTLPRSEFEQKYPFLVQNRAKIGYYITHSTMSIINKQDFVIQSEASMLAVKEYFEPCAKSIADLCAAPGGKSVFLKECYLEQNKSVEITACDIHSHRVELIKKYAASAPCALTVLQNDATVLNSAWIDAFDLVICDVPCSGIGTVGAKPEIMFYRSEDDVNKLKEIQLKILLNSAQYVKKGGHLCYSTCTVLKKENDFVIEEFLKRNSDFEIFKELRLFPHIDGCDGFYVCKLKKVK